MKPLHLEMTAFGAFAGHTVIPFEAFGAHGVYLITGRTGSGKTTIFDAVSYALYGEASGGKDRRETKNIHSDYVSDRERMEVSLTFEHQGKRYTAERSGSLRRGEDGRRVMTAKASLVCESDGSVIADTPTTVTKEITGMLGLSREQFAQTVMIAQGQFQRIITAKSEERKALFQNLFHTGIFEQFESRLKKQASDFAHEDELLKTHVLSAMNRCVFSEAHKPDVPCEIGAAAKFAAALTDQTAGDGEQLAAETEALGKLRAENERLIRSIEENRTLAQQTEELAAKQQDYAACEARKPEMRTLLDEIKAARQAAEVQKHELMLDKLMQDHKANTEKRDSLTQALELQTVQEQQAAKRLAEAQHAAEALPALQEEKASLERAVPRLREMQARSQEYEKAVTLYSRLGKEAERAAQTHRSMMEAFFKGQAGLMAEQLTDGEPCPVCGALHHPTPAVREQGTPSEADCKKAELARDRAQNAASAQEKHCTELKTELDTLRKDPLLSGQTEADLKARLAQTEQRVRAIEQERAAAEKLSRSESAKLAQLSGSRDALTQTIAENERDIQSCQTVFDAALRESGFADRAAYERAKRPADVLAGKEQTLQNFKHRYESLRESIADLTAKIGGREAQPLEPLEARRSTLQDEIAAKDGHCRALHATLTQNRATEQELRRLIGQMDRLRQESGVVTEMYRTVSGQMGSGQAKLRLETFVQQHYFRRVIHRANQRLSLLTDDQFALRCRESAKDLRAQSGLDLEVWDRSTARWRDISTLSGGESFLASLSMALGLSDVVQENSGGIQLDAMFIDEGFGTLDEETLRQAVALLGKLADGKRQIGVISHVEALRTRIEQQICVTKTADGSRVRLAGTIEA